MRAAQLTRRLILPGLAALAVAAATCGPAIASSLTGSGITYATQSVAASSGGGSVTVEVSAPLGTPVQYTSNMYATGASASFSITFTLPSGVTFTNNPSATGDGVFFAATLSQVSGGVGNNFITFTGTANVPGAPLLRARFRSARLTWPVRPRWRARTQRRSW